jgi:hypothetical protein
LTRRAAERLAECAALDHVHSLIDHAENGCIALEHAILIRLALDREGDGFVLDGFH